MKRQYSVGEIANILSAGRSTVIYWIKDGLIKAFQLPGGNNRVTHANLVKFMRKYNIPVEFIDGDKSKGREFALGQITRILNVSRSTVLTWIKDGRIKAFQLPGGSNRITRENLIGFMNRCDIPLNAIADGIKTRVLIAESDKRTLKRLKKALIEEGNFRVRMAPAALQIGTIVKDFQPDIVILDIRLEDIKLDNICKKLRHNPELSETKIIATSKTISAKKGKELLKQGFDGYLRKPFKVDEVVAEIERLL